MGTPPQAVVKAAQLCLPSCSSLVPLPQHRRTTSGLTAEHPGALLPPPADKPKPLWFVPSGPATKENCNAEGEDVLTEDPLKLILTPPSTKLKMLGRSESESTLGRSTANSSMERRSTPHLRSPHARLLR